MADVLSYEATLSAAGVASGVRSIISEFKALEAAAKGVNFESMANGMKNVLSQVKAEARAVEKALEFKPSNQAADSFGRAWKQELKGVEQAAKGMDRAMDSAAISKAASNAKGSFSSLSSEISNATKGLNFDNLGSSLGGLKAHFSSLGSHVASVFGSIKGHVSSLASNVMMLAGPLGAMGAGLGAMMTVGAGVSSAMGWEKGMAGVFKTTNIDKGTAEATAMNDSLLELYSTMRGVGKEDITGVASALGTLGVSRDQIKDTTRIVLQDSAAFKMSSEEVANKMAVVNTLWDKQSEKMGGAAAVFKQMGSAVNELGNQYSATESNILSFMSEAGGTLSSRGVSMEGGAAFGGFLETVGLKGAQAGTAIRSAISEGLFSTAVDTSKTSRGYKLAAELLGISGTEFKDRISKDMAGTLIDTASAVEKQNLNSADKGQLYQKLFGAYGQDLGTRIAGRKDLYNEMLGVSQEAFASGTSAEEEYTRQTNNATDALGELKASLDVAGIKAFSATLDPMAGKFGEWASSVREAYPEIEKFGKALGEGDWEGMGQGISQALESARGAVSGFGSWVQDSLQNVDWSATGRFLSSEVGKTAGWIKSGLESINYSDVGAALLTVMSGAWEWASQGFINTLSSGDDVGGPFRALAEILRPTFEYAFSGLEGAAIPALNAVGAAAYEVANAIGSGITGAINTVIAAFGSLAGIADRASGRAVSIMLGLTPASSGGMTAVDESLGITPKYGGQIIHWTGEGNPEGANDEQIMPGPGKYPGYFEKVVEDGIATYYAQKMDETTPFNLYKNLSPEKQYDLMRMASKIGIAEYSKEQQSNIAGQWYDIYGNETDINPDAFVNPSDYGINPDVAPSAGSNGLLNALTTLNTIKSGAVGQSVAHEEAEKTRANIAAGKATTDYAKSVVVADDAIAGLKDTVTEVTGDLIEKGTNPDKTSSGSPAEDLINQQQTTWIPLKWPGIHPEKDRSGVPEDAADDITSIANRILPEIKADVTRTADAAEKTREEVTGASSGASEAAAAQQAQSAADSALMANLYTEICGISGFFTPELVTPMGALVTPTGAKLVRLGDEWIPQSEYESRTGSSLLSEEVNRARLGGTPYNGTISQADMPTVMQQMAGWTVQAWQTALSGISRSEPLQGGQDLYIPSGTQIPAGVRVPANLIPPGEAAMQTVTAETQGYYNDPSHRPVIELGAKTTGEFDSTVTEATKDRKMPINVDVRGKEAYDAITDKVVSVVVVVSVVGGGGGSRIAYGNGSSGSSGYDVLPGGVFETGAGSLVSHYAEGGYTGEGGPAMLHPGEWVIPSKGGPVIREGGSKSTEPAQENHYHFDLRGSVVTVSDLEDRIIRAVDEHSQDRLMR